MLVKELEFLGLIINSVTITLTLTNENVFDFRSRCTPLLPMPQTTIIELTKLLGKLLFSISFLPGRI